MSNNIAQNLQRLNTDKNNICDALITKGVIDAQDHGFDDFAEDILSIDNQYTLEDEGKVVSGGGLTSQTSTNITLNGQYNTTTNNQINVNVPNTFEVEDEGKVVNNGSLIAQTSTIISTSGIYDTTLYNNINVDIEERDNLSYNFFINSIGASASGGIYKTGSYSGTLTGDGWWCLTAFGKSDGSYKTQSPIKYAKERGDTIQAEFTEPYGSSDYYTVSSEVYLGFYSSSTNSASNAIYEEVVISRHTTSRGTRNQTVTINLLSTTYSNLINQYPDSYLKLRINLKYSAGSGSGTISYQVSNGTVQFT